MHSGTHPQTSGGRLHRAEGLEAGTDRVLDLGRLLLGLTVVALGVLFLLDGAGTLDAGRTIGQWWPALLIAGGLLTLAERPPAIARGAVLTGVGVLALLFTTDVLEGSAWDYVWPALIIVAGLAILARWQGRTVHAGADVDDVVRATAVFGGPKLVCTAQHFRGAWLTAFFGGITLDLRGARPAPGGATINATTAFGGVEILVPRGWKISIRSTPIFGGVEDKTDHSGPPPEDAPILHIDAVTVFGGLDIKHGK